MLGSSSSLAVAVVTGWLLAGASPSPTNTTSCEFNGIAIQSKTFLIGQNASIFAECDQATGQLLCSTDTGDRLPECPSSNDYVVHPCFHFGTRIVSYQRLQHDIEGNAYYAFCNERVHPPTLRCFRDSGVADGAGKEDHEIPCQDAPRAATVKTAGINSQRQLGVYPHDLRVWPKGVICYQSQSLAEVRADAVAEGDAASKIRSDATIMAFTYATTKPTEKNMKLFKLPEVDIKTTFAAAKKEYSDKTDIEFISIKDCPTEAAKYDKQGDSEANKICGGCKHFTRLTFEARTSKHPGCQSIVGYKASTTQFLNLSYGCWSKKTMLHEMGHTVGLDHDHQHKDRTIIIVQDKVEAAFKELAAMGANPFSTNLKLRGEYDIKSVMHYDTGKFSAFCLPKADPPKGRWCNFGEKGSDCTVPKEEHCDRSRDDEIGGKELSAKDVETIEKLYDDEFKKRLNAKKKKRDRSPSSEAVDKADKKKTKKDDAKEEGKQ